MTIAINSIVHSKDFPEALVVDMDGTEAFIEFPDGNLDTALLADLSLGVRPMARPKSPKAPKTKVVVTAPASDKPVKGKHVPAESQVLTCAEGHTWTRAPQRGKPPKFCPHHAPAAPEPAERRTRPQSPPQEPQSDAPTQQTLYCEAGKHEWQRESKRGKPPTNCPEHMVTGVSRQVSVPMVDLARLNPSYDDTLKLNYITEQLARGRDPLDANHLLKTRADIVRRLKLKAVTA